MYFIYRCCLCYRMKLSRLVYRMKLSRLVYRMKLLRLVQKYPWPRVQPPSSSPSLSLGVCLYYFISHFIKLSVLTIICLKNTNFRIDDFIYFIYNLFDIDSIILTLTLMCFRYNVTYLIVMCSTMSMRERDNFYIAWCHIYSLRMFDITNVIHFKNQCF